jgi:signal peptidase I
MATIGIEQDSRFWGFVPKNNLLGKPLLIYWSFETGRDAYLPSSLSTQLAVCQQSISFL